MRKRNLFSFPIVALQGWSYHFFFRGVSVKLLGVYISDQHGRFSINRTVFFGSCLINDRYRQALWTVGALLNLAYRSASATLQAYLFSDSDILFI